MKGAGETGFLPETRFLVVSVFGLEVIVEHSLLAVFAHPDDEAFGTGGTLARYASEGVATTLVCATRGEAGEIAEGTGATPETLGAVRENELRCAAETMGVRELLFLGYRDSGMAGTPENQHPEAFINAPAEEAVGQLVAIIRRVRPEIVVTFEPNGGYGHPDHIAIHRHTVAAFHSAADPAWSPELGEPWQAARLYYTAIPRSFFRRMIDEMKALGMDEGEYQVAGGGGRPGLARRECHCRGGCVGHGRSEMGGGALPPNAVWPRQSLPPPPRCDGQRDDEPGTLLAGLARARGRQGCVEPV